MSRKCIGFLENIEMRVHAIQMRPRLVKHFVYGEDSGWWRGGGILKLQMGRRFRAYQWKDLFKSNNLIKKFLRYFLRKLCLIKILILTFMEKKITKQI